MALVGSFSFNSFLSGVLSSIGTAFLASRFNVSLQLTVTCTLGECIETNSFMYVLLIVCLWIQVNKENKEFKVIIF